MIANDVLKMLESRHAKDAFFSEVAIDSNKRRMDAWAMIPSYSKSDNRIRDQGHAPRFRAG